MCDMLHQHLGGWNIVHWRGCGWSLCIIMLIFHNYGCYISFHPWRTYRFITYCIIFHSYQIQSHQNSTLVMGKFEYLVNMAALLVGCLRVLVLKVDIFDAVKKKRATLAFGLQGMLAGCLCVSVPFTLQLYCGTRSKLD